MTITISVRDVSIFLIGIVLTLALGAAYSTIAQGEDETIIACVQKQNGNTRIVSSTADCGNQENVVEWNALSLGAPFQPGIYINSSTQNTRPMQEAVAVCPDGEIVLGGGVEIIDGMGEVRIIANRPGSLNSWYGYA